MLLNSVISNVVAFIVVIEMALSGTTSLPTTSDDIPCDFAGYLLNIL